MIWASAYDKNWKEWKNTADVNIPKTMRRELFKNNKELRCNKYEHGSIGYNICVVDEKKKHNKLKIQLIGKYYFSYPQVLKFEFKPHQAFSGPEDPYVLLKNTTHGSEPIIFFNMEEGNRRKLCALAPRRSNKKKIQFSDSPNGWRIELLVTFF